MAKLIVITEPGRDRVPFLRGILVQSLRAAGLSFEDAYATAQRVREVLGGKRAVTTSELKTCVARQLETGFSREVRRSYETGSDRAQEIIVRSQRRESPFSVGILTRSLEACAIDRESAREVARRVREAVQESGRSAIDLPALRRLIHEMLRQFCSEAAADCYLSRRRFEASGDPLIILVGGATGTGKSTVSSALAYRLDIVRTQSTDMMREIIRSYLAPHVVPTLGYSSFEAWRGLPALNATARKRVTDNPMIAGFLAQFAALQYEVIELFAEGDRVAARYRLTANFDGHPLDIPGVMLFELRDGLIARRTDVWDSLTFLRQTGAVAERPSA